MKKYILLFLALWTLTILGMAQTNIDPLLDSYVQKAKTKDNLTLVLSKLENSYQKMSEADQQAFCNQIYQKIKSLQFENKNEESVILIDLYEHFAKEGDAQMPLLYYVKGQISAEMKDTITLKLCIADLENYSSASNAISQYTDDLQRQLQAIRDYVPIIERMDGVWVSNISIKQSINSQQIPLFIIYVDPTDNSAQRFHLGGDWSANYLKKADHMNAQKAVVEGETGLLIWSNEKITIPDQDIRSELKGFGIEMENVMKNAITESDGNFIQNMSAGLVGNMMSAGFNAIIDEIFTPRKKINIATCTFYQENPYEIVAKIHTRAIKIKGTNEPQVEDNDYEVLFTKWNQDFNFTYWAGIKGIFFPVPLTIEGDSYDIKDNFSLRDSFRLLNELKKRYTSSFSPYKKLIKDNDAMDAYNMIQTQRAIYLNKQEMLSKGYQVSPQYHSKGSGAWLGCEFEPLPDKYEKKGNGHGVFIKKVDPLSSARLFGVDDKDILLSIDGFDVNTPEEAEEMIQSLTPFEKTTLQVQHGKKVRKVIVEPSYQLSQPSN